MTRYTILPITEKEAREIATWQYPAPFERYSFSNTTEDREEFLENPYYAVFYPSKSLVGYFCFETAAQIPTLEKSPYSSPEVEKVKILDIGLGMTPELCGQGLGGEFLMAGLNFVKTNYPQVEKLRLTVGKFNERAIKVYEKAGFSFEKEVHHQKSGEVFQIRVRKI